MPVQYANTLKRKHSSVFEMSKAGLRFWIEREWKNRIEAPNINVVYAPTLDAFRQAGIDDGKPGVVNRDQLPILSMILASVQDRNAPFLPWPSQTFGFVAAKNPTRTSARVEKLRPVEVGIGIRFRASDEEVVLAFAEMLLSWVPNQRFDIENQKTGTIIECAIKVEPNVSLPTPSMGTPGDFRDLETTLILETWMGWSETVGLVRSVETRLKEGTPEEPKTSLLGFRSSGDRVTVKLTEEEMNQ